jgi:predicted lipoprotein with Yx(FWY)xxD motif
VKRVFAVLVGPIVIAVLAGCGSGSKGTTAASQPTTAGSAVGQPATTSPYATSATASGASTVTAALITTKPSKMGTILAYGPRRLTVYLFEGDNGSASSCAGECAIVWPPVTGRPQASGQAMSSHLGTVTRSGGAAQVTYNGHPLYLYARDKDDGDAYGQALTSFGASWYVLAPSGNKVDTS